MMSRIRCVAAMVVLSGGFLAATQFAEAQTRESRSRKLGGLPALKSRGESAINLLNKRVETIAWEEEPFEQVIDWLKQEGENMVNIVVRWGPLSVESIDRDTPVSLELNNTTVAETLVEVLELLSDSGELRFHAIRNTLRISTKADTDRKKFVRVYDVTDILFRVRDFGEAAPNIDLQNTSSGGGGGGGGQSVFQGGSGGQEQTGGDQEEQELEERLEELRDLIQETIAPETWDTATGAVAGTGRIRTYRRSLVVYNTIEVHEMISGTFSFGE